MGNDYIVRQSKDGIGLYGNNLVFFQCKDPEAICVGPADTGKTYAICLKVHLCACKYPGAAIAIVRKTQTSCYNTVIRTLTEKIMGTNVTMWPCVPYGGLNRTERFNYHNGSVIYVMGLDKPSRILSGEFDLVYVNQAEEISLYDWETLTTRTTGRAGHMPYAQVIGDCNPSHPTHWIRQRAQQGHLTLLESSHRDNPDLYDQQTGNLTAEGQRRLARLRSLSGSRLLRWYHGLWAAPEGAIYSVFDEDRHKVKAFPIPPLWPRFVGIDPIGAYIAAVWVALDPVNNILNVYREYLQPFGIPTGKHVENILQLSRGETIFYWVVGAKAERQAREDWRSHGIPGQEPAVVDVWAGIDRINSLLGEFSLVIHDSCPNLLGEVGDYRRVLKQGEPTEAIENKEIYHLLDSLRYSIVGPEGAGQQTEIIYRPAMVGRQW